MTTKPDIMPFLRYEDAQAAIDWLVGTCGFELKTTYPGENNSIDHAELTLGNGLIMLSTAKEDPLGLRSISQVGGVSQGIYIAVEDIQAHFETARGQGAEIVMPLEDRGYGSDYTVRDPEGFLWSFGDYRPE